MSKFYISGFSDEISSDCEQQFKYLNKLNIKYYEPRGVFDKNISDLTESEAKELKKMMDFHGISASSIGSPIGKINIKDDFDIHLEKLKNTLNVAHILNTDFVRMFSFYVDENPADVKNEVLYKVSEMVEIAEKESICLLHENEKGIYGDTADRCLDLFSEIKSKYFGGVFDPANFIQCGEETYPNAFNKLKPYIKYMHIKDATFDGTVYPCGYGNGKLFEILSQLCENGFNGFLSLEPHLGEFKGFTSLEKGDMKLKEYEGTSEDRFCLAYESLIKILNKIEGVKYE